MKIYRLEDPSLNRGPHTAVNYSEDSQAAWDLANASPGAPTDNRPAPSRDFPFGWGWREELRERFCCDYDDIIFGCESLEALQQWFDGELFELLQLAGHEVKIYEVADKFAFKGRHQVAFRKPEPRLAS